MNEIFESAVRSAGDLAGVFECDGETGYFYLYEVDVDSGDKIADVIWIFSGQPDFSQSDVSVRWDSSQRTVGLLIGTVLWAAFDPRSKQKFGGDYRSDGAPNIPNEVIGQFAHRQ